MNPRVFFIVGLLVALTGCTKMSHPAGELDDGRDLAAFLNGEEKRLYVRAELESKVLQSLGATQLKEGFAATVKGETVEFSVVRTATPVVYTPDVFGHFVEPKALFAKIYFKAQCGQVHLGFTSPCVPTFGPHRAFGNSMVWQVQNWHSCTLGDSICIERLKQVGTIFYYNGTDCMDTMFVTRKIMRFRCD